MYYKKLHRDTKLLTKDIDIKKLASAIGVDRAYLSQIRSEKRIASEKVYKKIVEALKPNLKFHKKTRIVDKK